MTDFNDLCHHSLMNPGRNTDHNEAMENGHGNTELREMYMSAEDTALCQELRNSLRDVLTHFYDKNFNLFRWLLASHRQVETASSKLRIHLRFRRLMNFNTLSGSDLPLCETMQQYYPRINFDEDPLTSSIESPLVILMLGRLDIAGIYNTVSATDLILAQLGHAELLLRQCMRAESVHKRRCAATVVLDLGGMEFHSWTAKALREMFPPILRALHDNYPEIVSSIVIINAGNFLHRAMQHIEPLLSDSTRAKINVLGHNWKEEMVKIIPADSLPPFFGGSNMDDDRIFTYEPLTIPRQVYYDNNMHTTDELSLDYIVVGKMVSEIASIYVSEVYTTLTWVILAEDGCLLAIYYSEDKLSSDVNLIPSDSPGSIELIYPPIEVFNGKVPCEGSIVCSKPGWYNAEFTNNSEMFSKSIKYKLCTEQPE